jgi:hypothetical protein
MTITNFFRKLTLIALVTFIFSINVAQGQIIPSSADLPVRENERRLGPYTLGGQSYSVVLTTKCLPGRKHGAQETLTTLRILDASGAAVQQEEFPFELAGGTFTRSLSATVMELIGQGGTALAVQFVEARPGQPLQESWQLFGVVNGRLKQFGAPLPVGQDNAVVGGVVTAVMVKGGIAVVPLASTAEAMEFPIWAGRFYVYVPIRVDWKQGTWSQGVQCFAPGDGRLHEDGCNMHAEAEHLPAVDAAATAVLLSPEPRDNAYVVRYVPIHAATEVEILGTRAIATWQENEGRVECRFGDLWLRVRINNIEGWVNSDDSFTALGLPGGHLPE